MTPKPGRLPVKSVGASHPDPYCGSELLVGPQPLRRIDALKGKAVHFTGLLRCIQTDRRLPTYAATVDDKT